METPIAVFVHLGKANIYGPFEKFKKFKIEIGTRGGLPVAGGRDERHKAYCTPRTNIGRYTSTAR